jgi:tellurite resistance protein
MNLSDDDRFNLEVLKLLLQVAWSDGVVDPRESDMIFGLGRSWLVPEAELQHLHEDLAAGRRSPPPDHAILKRRAEEAVQAATALVLADGKVRPEETALLEQVKAALAA